MQMVTYAWGQMGPGDSVSIEADASSSVESFNYTEIGLSPVEYDWSMSVWNMTGMHRTGEYNLAFKFDSDSSQASGGIAVDSFLLFAIERVLSTPSMLTATIPFLTPISWYLPRLNHCIVELPITGMSM